MALKYPNGYSFKIWIFMKLIALLELPGLNFVFQVRGRQSEKACLFVICEWHRCHKSYCGSVKCVIAFKNY